jgi:D-alanine-D-alanine ligase
MRRVFKSVGLPITEYLVFLRRGVREESEKIVSEIEKKLNYPIFTKPANLGSSVGITKAHNRKELETGLSLASSYDRKIIVEQGVEEAREIEVAVLGNDWPKASVCGEVVPSREFYDYEDKYIIGKQQLIIPAPVQGNTSDKIRNMAKQAFKAIDAAGMARVDFFLDSKNNKIFVDEINTIPGFTSISMYPKLWEASGIKYSQLIDQLIELALERYNDKRQSKTNFPSKLLK